MPQKLTIPERYTSSLAELVRLSPEELSALLNAVHDEKPTLGLMALTDSIAQKLSIDRKRMSRIVQILAELQEVREGFGLSIDDFVDELRTAIEATGKAELRPAEWPAFEAAITEALSGENALAISSKARSVMGEYPRVYCSARILTDLRPVFKSDVEKEPAAFVVMHTLKIIYHENEEHREIFIAVDADDLGDLAIQLERAVKKESSLKALSADKGLTILGGQS
jgi:hypothetical protein